MTLAPGLIRDSIVDFLSTISGDASTKNITTAIQRKLGDVPASSIRSYLNLNTPKTFERTSRGRYKLNVNGHLNSIERSNSPKPSTPKNVGAAKIIQGDCFEWLAQQPSASIHAVVTDPPYGLVEYTAKETAKLRAGKGGVWRIPPSFDGHQRAPLPRFTTLTDSDRDDLFAFFKKFALHVSRVAVPGANVIVASNPLLAHIVSNAMTAGGLELRGYLVRQVMTMRGGDRPKNAHKEFDDVSVMPRSQWEPWVILRNPLDGRVQDNLRKWKTGGFRRLSKDKPFGDLIRSHPTSSSERKIAAHPSLKPQAFMRQIVRAALPLGAGIVLDPFMGGGSTIAAANAVGYSSIGVELDSHFFEIAHKAIPKLSELDIKIKEDK